MAAGKGGGCGGGGGMERVRRCVRTVYFVVRMVGSLLVLSAPLLVAMADVAAHCLLVSTFVCVRCVGVREQLGRYDFRTGLIDFPLVSVIRSLLNLCVYSFCDGPTLSHGPYLRITSLCSFVSVLILFIKACVFQEDSETEILAPSSMAMQKLHLKTSREMPVLLLSSMVFALGHILGAYRTRCRARRKLLFHQVDPESLLSYKHMFASHQKVPRSPTPSAARTPRCNSEIRRKVSCTVSEEEEVSVRLLADIDSLFTTCCGLTLHYKLSSPSSPASPILASSSFGKTNSCCRLPQGITGRLKLAKSQLNDRSKVQYQRHISFSNPLSDTLHKPLLDQTGDLEKSGKCGIVLVHGFGGGVFSWRHIMASLAQHVGCMVAAFDRPGWGITSRLKRNDWEDKELPNPYKLESQVDLLLSFCAMMGFSSVVLVGHDDGGLLVLKAALRIQACKSPKITIRGVVLLSVSLSRDVVPPLARILLRTSLGKKHLVRPLLRTEITQVVNRRSWYDVTKLTEEVLSFYKAPLCIEGWDDALNEIARLSSETVLSSKRAGLLLKEMGDLSILITAGSEDALVSFKSAQAMASKLVNSRLVAISKCGHLPHEECPEAVLSAILPFITRLVPVADSQKNP